MAKEYYGWRFDIMKIILAILVVMIHTYVLPDSLAPILTVAVPLFFVCSSYFFWTKVKDGADIYECLRKFIGRNLKLYIFWLVVLLIPTVFINKWFMKGIPFLQQILFLVRDFFFGSLFQASWFLVALPIGMLIVCLLSEKLRLNNIALLVISLFPISFCWIGGLNNYVPVVSSLMNNVRIVIPYPSCSFLVSYLWIVLGKIIAENSHNTKIHINVIFASAVSLAGLILTCIESRLSPSSYLLSPIIPVLCIFMWVVSIKETKQKNLRWCRQASIIIYCSHKTISILINAVSRFILGTEVNAELLFTMTLLLSILLSYGIILLSKKENWSILRYAY